jgi:hypothetical protein
VDGAPAMPVSTLLEYAIAGAEWIRPAGHRPVRLHDIRDVECRLRALRAPARVYTFTRDARATEDGDDWIVHVSIVTAESQSAFRGALVYRNAPLPDGDRVAIAPAPSRRIAVDSALRWRGTVFAVADWTANHDDVWTAAVRPYSRLDAWATVVPPAAALPSNHIENVIRAAASLGSTPAGHDRLHIEGIHMFDAGEPDSVIGDAGGAHWQIVDDDGRVALAIVGLGFRPRVTMRKNV